MCWFFFFSSRRRHTRFSRDWSSDVCSSDLDLADLTNIGTLFAFILVCLGVNALRRVAPERPRPFRVPLVPIFPLLGVLLCVALRSEERRVGKECRAQRAPYQIKTNAS